MTEQEFLIRLQNGEDFNELVQEAALRNLAAGTVRSNHSSFGSRPIEGNLDAGITPQGARPV